MRMAKALRANRDLPQLELINLNAQAGAGAGSDYEHIIAFLPDLTVGAGSGLAGDVPQNSMSIRACYLCFEATLTGANTNNVTYNFWQKRAGAILVNTTISAVASTGVQAVTPASMANIFVGSRLAIAAGGGSAETVTVISVTGTTFTANFTSTHNAATACTSAPLATITYALGTNEAAYVPHQFNVPVNSNFLKGGDVITVARVTLGTGLATPAVTVGIDWTTSGPQ